MSKSFFALLISLGLCRSCIVRAQSAVPDTQRIVAFGTTINPLQQIGESRMLAKSLGNPGLASWQAKGDQHRKYFFKEAKADMPYRLYVPQSWDGKKKLPMVVFLHGAWNDESSYVDADNKLMLALAEQYGFLLLSPMGYSKFGGYGSCLLLPGIFGKQEEIKKIISNVTVEKQQMHALSEKDVINTIELVLNEYPIDTSKICLTGHSMGAGGTLYLGAKYNQYWKALAPMSGPFADKDLYPWHRVKHMPLFVSEGLKAGASLESSRLMKDWLLKEKFNIIYKEVDGDHGGMVPQILPDVFAFLYQQVVN
jgi:predicted esterase